MVSLRDLAVRRIAIAEEALRRISEPAAPDRSEATRGRAAGSAQQPRGGTPSGLDTRDEAWAAGEDPGETLLRQELGGPADRLDAGNEGATDDTGLGASEIYFEEAYEGDAAEHPDMGPGLSRGSGYVGDNAGDADHEEGRPRRDRPVLDRGDEF